MNIYGYSAISFRFPLRYKRVPKLFKHFPSTNRYQREFIKNAYVTERRQYIKNHEYIVVS